MKKAFTLIELLVVIAIIAILAAILFPVFAQAKLAAKGAASVSNAKQMSLSHIMYSGDYDDTFVLGAAWNTGSDPVTFGPGNALSPWTWLIQPYQKNAEIGVDPAGPGEVTTALGRTLSLIVNPNYGYNHTHLSPYFGAAAGGTKPVTQTTPANPADTVLLTSKFTSSERTGTPLDAYIFNGSAPFQDRGPLLNAIADSPDCDSIAQACLGNWGTGAGGNWEAFLLAKKIAGSNSGGNAGRVADGVVTAFTDGHVKKLKKGALAIGTNWSDTSAASALIQTDTTKYIWDIN